MIDRDVERIVRDVLTARAPGVVVLRVEPASNRWRVMVKDRTNRITSFDVPDAPAAIRAATTEWADEI